MIAVGYPLNITFGLLNLYLPAAAANLLGLNLHGGLGAVSGPSRNWYIAGAALTAAHMAFGKKALGLIAEIVEEDGEKVASEKKKRPSTAAMAEWIRMNALRSLVTDLPAWGCYLVGFLVWSSQ